MKIEVDQQTVFFSNGSGQPETGAPAIIFLHGAAMDHSVWVMLARYFARKGYRVIAPDLPGHGQSAGDPLTSITQLRDWVLGLQDALGLTSSSLVGHSMGSLISFAVAASNPGRVDALALLGTSSPMPVSDGLLDAALDNHPAAIEMANTWSHSATGKLGRGGNPGQWNLHVGLRLMQRAAPGVLHADLAACNAFVAEDFGRISDTRTLVIAGAADQMTPPRAGLKVAAAIDNCEQLVLPGCGHSMLSEQPNGVLDALAAFIR